MSSAICQNFVQNAWKKELCSNCFKSKDEHAVKAKPKPIQFISNNKIEGIIKNSKKCKTKLSVGFLKDLTEVIGYGGEDWCSENEDEEEYESSDNDFIIESEDEDETIKELKRITKENTDFNTTSLGHEIKKSHAQLLLGKPVMDASGKKQTLLVSVTPYGEEPATPAKKYITKTLSHIPIAKNNKDVIAETKTNVVLTSYTKNSDEILPKEEKSLLDEISETLENGKNPIQIIKKKSQLEKSNTVNESNKENEKSTENIKSETKKNELSVDNKLLQLSKVANERKISLSRTPALKRDTEKPVVYQTSTAKIELMNTKNLKITKEAVNINNKTKDEVNNNEKPNNETTISSMKENILNTTKLIESEKQHSKNELPVSKSKDVKDEINLTVAEKTSDDKVLGLPPPVPLKYPISFSQTREQAGKPDGREDPAISEVPPLPVTPPPVLETQSSFLHGITGPIYEKPKIPSKPAIMLVRKPAAPNIQASQTQHLTTFVPEKPIEKTSLSKQDSTESDYKMNKRRAPKPPEENPSPIYSRNSTGAINIDSPVVREKDKRERASSCTPKMLGINGNVNGESHYASPEPAPRKSLSVSTDCLASEDKRREKTKGRFSLKKFLRMGSNKDVSKVVSDSSNSKHDDNDLMPHPKPRLVIVHPSELNGSKVEVVSKPIIDQVDQCVNNEYSSANSDYETYNLPKTTTKPPPPPRHFNEVCNNPKPALPPPPKSVEILKKQKQISRSNSVTKKSETVYANIGEVRSAIIPNKPVRTASMREREALQQKQLRKNHNYEPINVQSGDNSENVYDYINSTRSSSPDSDSSREKNSPKSKTVRLGKRSESSIDVSGEYFKYGNIPRSMSLTYCGSETESEIYSPYGFYGSESEVTEDDHDWIQNGRTHKLRSRKGRSIVHKNLEDNYGAVVVANHEALAQVLENIHQTNHIQPALRGLKNSPNLRWSDFSMKSGITPVVIGTRVFHQALWGAQHVTLVVNAGTVSTSSTLSLGTFNLTPVTEFSDLVPNDILAKPDKDKDGKHIQATISVLPWLQVNTIQTYGEILQSKMLTNEETYKDSNFIMLQFVNALKTLQAQGIEELPLSLNSFVLCKDMEKDSNHRLCVLQGVTTDVSLKSTQEKYGTLCVCALKALNYLQTSPKITTLLQSLLNHERAVSLTQVKSILEFSLWGPTDVSLGSTIKERELGLQRWLDLQRATVLHGLVCARVQLTVYEEFHLLFLVRSNARMMSDASLLIESSNMKHSVTSIHNKSDKYVAS